jgi:pimeloyl-ACP methyl ester carboxylesterase
MKWLNIILSLFHVIDSILLKYESKKHPVRKGNYYDWRFGKIFYTVNGEGPPLLLVHGIGLGKSSRDWDAYTDGLAKKHRVYAIDLLGFGYSEAPAITYSAYLYTALIRDFLSQVIGSPVKVITKGHSAVFAVKAYTQAPDCIEKIVLVNPFAKKTDDNRLLGFLLSFPVIGAVIYRIIGVRLFLSKANYTAARIQGAQTRFVFADAVSGLLEADVTKDLTQIKIPVLKIRGKGLDIDKVVKWLGEQ